tara:strand:+ start:117 stop:851 length:735 start_codon:yes stop_codon:yes gene_type:complete
MKKNLKKFDICLVIPTLNEEKNILDLKLALDNNLNINKYFICFVDDSPNNLTKNKIKLLFKRKNIKILHCGKNDRCKAVKLGLKWSYKNVNSNFFIEMDSDLSHNPKDIKKNLEIILSGNYNLIIFSKYLKRSKHFSRDKDRVFISFIVSKICNILFNKKIKDYSNSFRVYDRKAISILMQKKISYIAPLENLNILLFLMNKIKIKEVASSYKGRIEGISSINFKQYLKFSILFIKLVLFYVTK